jgi:predicted peroxiredoxin
MKKTITLIITSPPAKLSHFSAAMDTALAAASCEHDVRIIFLDKGLRHLTEAHAAILKLLKTYGIEAIYAFNHEKNNYYLPIIHWLNEAELSALLHQPSILWNY